MTVSRITCTSQSQLLEACVKQAIELSGTHSSVSVIVGSEADAQPIKVLLCEQDVLGVRVQSLPHWLQDQWDLWGDGSRLVEPVQRHVLLRPLLAQMTGIDPSSKYVKHFSSFVQDALSLGVDPDDESVSSALEGYRGSLESRGLKDPAQTYKYIAENQSGSAVVFVSPVEGHAIVDRLIWLLGESTDVTVLERGLPCNQKQESEHQNELSQLRAMLFSGQMGLEPQGSFTAAEALGIHGEAAVVRTLVQRGLDKVVEPQDIVVVLPKASAAYPHIVQELADAGVPLSCEFSVPLCQTAFGAAFLQLEALLGEEDDGYVNTIAFISSPYSGLSASDARGFAAIWRSQAGSSHESRLLDITKGVKDRVPAKVWDEKLLRIRSLLEIPAREDRVRAMFENGCASGFDDVRVADDAAAADVLLDYLELCASLGCEPSVKDMGDLSVDLARATEGVESRVRICEPGQVPLGSSGKYIVFGRLDKDSYSMAASPEPFDGFLAQMGGSVERDAALKNRILLLDALESAANGFACYRLTTDAEGSERCQSALWDELMTAYKTEGEKDDPPHELPAALVQTGFGLRLSEADIFCRGVLEEVSRVDVARGRVSEAALELLIPDSENYGEAFSPTAIEDYYRCPYRWFICRRVGANSLDKPFDQIAKGNLAHAVLERFYLDLKEKGIPRVTKDNLEECLAIANVAFEWQRQHEIDRHRLNLVSDRDWLESELVRTQVIDLVKRDAHFLPGFQPMYLELKLEDPDGKALSYAGVPVRGKVDRIDVDRQGRAVVIDYKLSGLSSGYGLSKNSGFPSRIQTDIYGTLVQRCLQAQGLEVQVIGSVYRSYAKNCLRGVYAEGIEWGGVENVKPSVDALPGSAILDSYPVYLEKMEEMVSGLMEKMREGDVAPNPLCKDACEYCLAAGFCRERR